MGFDENKGTYSRICYLYVPEEFTDGEIAFLLMDEYKNVALESGISENLVEVFNELFDKYFRRYNASKECDTERLFSCCQQDSCTGTLWNL